MKTNASKFSESRRRRIVDEYLNGAHSAERVATKHRISRSTLMRWRRELYPTQAALPDAMLPADADLLNRAGVQL